MKAQEQDCTSEVIDLAEAILDCWPECGLAKGVMVWAHLRPGTTEQLESLQGVWNEIPTAVKLEAGYDEDD